MADPQSAPSPAPKRSRKVLWIVLGIAGAILFVVILLGALGVYFVSRNLDLERASATEASQSFDEVRAQFKDVPIITLDDRDRVTLSRPPPEKAAADRPKTMHVMAYDRGEERIVRVTIPFWMLRIGREKIRLGAGRDLQLEDLQMSAEELERYGPALLLDHRDTDGARVLVWTQ